MLLLDFFCFFFSNTEGSERFRFLSGFDDKKDAENELLAVELSPRDAAIGDENELLAVELSPSNAALECKVPEKIHMAV